MYDSLNASFKQLIPPMLAGNLLHQYQYHYHSPCQPLITEPNSILYATLTLTLMLPVLGSASSMNQLLREMVHSSRTDEIYSYLSIYSFMTKRLILIANNVTTALSAATNAVQRYTVCDYYIIVHSPNCNMN